MASTSLAVSSSSHQLPASTLKQNFTRNVYIIAGRGPVFVEGPVSAEKLAEYSFDSGLNNFRPAAKQHQALIDIAVLPNSFIYIVRYENTIIGYVTFCPPDEYLKWGNDKIAGLIELGAIEITPKWRREGLGIKLLSETFRTDLFEDYLIISMEYYWHWDVDKSELSIWEYRNMLAGVLGHFGFELWKTDDPDVRSHPANTFMVRVGKRVPEAWIAQMRYISTHRHEILGEAF